jgi:hypothetical protein
MNADVLPPGATTRDVGLFKAMEFVIRAPDTYWTTMDIVDCEGVSHVEIEVGARGCPSVTSYLATGVEISERQDDSGIVSSRWSLSSPSGVTSKFATLLRPDGTYILVIARNESSLTAGPTRHEPVLEPSKLLLAVSDLRP